MGGIGITTSTSATTTAMSVTSTPASAPSVAALNAGSASGYFSISSINYCHFLLITSVHTL